jgi:hypothetical protein
VLPWIIGGLVLLLVLWMAIPRPYHIGKGVGPDAFVKNIGALLVLSANGSSLIISAKTSDVRLEFSRVSGTEQSAGVLFRIPRAAWSETYETSIRNVLIANGYEVAKSNVKTETLLETWIDVPNIWENWAGARAARAAHLVLQAAEIGSGERFDSRLVGPGKWRRRPS